MADDLDATIAALEAIVDECATRNERCGYFAAMYLAVTRAVRARSAAGAFDNVERMERFVAAFAARYLDAYGCWRQGRRPVESWSLAFDAAQRRAPIILQHLLLGMNAHINLDLAATAADLGRASGNLESLERDFMVINEVLASLVGRCEDVICEVSPWMKMGDRLARDLDERMVSVALVMARQQAWKLAERLMTLDGEALRAALEGADATTTRVGRAMLDPGRWARCVRWVVRLRERAKPSEVIRLLSHVAP